MSLPIFQRTITNESGDILDGASVEVLKETDGTKATLYSDRAGTTTIANPTTADASGFVQFYTAGGEYKIVATKGGVSRTWRYEPIWSAQSKATVTSTGTQTVAGALDGRVVRLQSVQDLSDTTKIVPANLSGNERITLKGYRPLSQKGGPTLFWKADEPKTNHDGWSKFSPTVPWTSTLTDYRAGTGETDSGGTGCFVAIQGEQANYHDAGGESLAEGSDTINYLFDKSKDVTLPLNRLNISTSISLDTDQRLSGYGGEFGTRLQATADAPVFVNDFPTSRARVENMQIRGRLAEGTADASFLMDFSDMFICHYRDLHVGYAKNVIRIRGDAGGATAAGTSALFFDNVTLQYSQSDGYLFHNKGQYGVHFNQGTFERTIGAAGNGRVVVDSITSTDGNPFNKTSFSQCHFEEVDIIFNAEGCAVTQSHLGETSVVFTELSHNCQAVDNSAASVGHGIIDAGYGNRFNGTWVNTDFNGVRDFGLPNKTQILYDTGDSAFNGVADLEYVVLARKWVQTATEIANGFTGQIEIVNGASTPAVLESSSSFSVFADPSDPGNHSKLPKQIRTYIETVRLDSTNKIDVRNASQKLAYLNKIKNGTFKGNTFGTEWATVDTVTASAGTEGTLIGSANATWGIYQDVPTIPGRNYIAMVKGDQLASQRLWIGNPWDGSDGARRANSASRLMDGSYYGFIYFEAIAETTRIALGDLSASTLDVKWVSAIDISDKKTYASEAPSNTMRLDEVVYNIRRDATRPMAWIFQDDAVIWRTFGGTYS